MKKRTFERYLDKRRRAVVSMDGEAGFRQRHRGLGPDLWLANEHFGQELGRLRGCVVAMKAEGVESMELMKMGRGPGGAGVRGAGAGGDHGAASGR